ncbi:sialin isoform X2 [Hydra vulgaris]|uniref:Sialin isoform X2 n=1 Tax=Hydra vulgaris TaxID=6087 RepID=A0ABM4BRI7_HYDVU
MSIYIPKRYVVAVLGHFAIFIMYTMRANLSVALVAMVKTSKLHNKVLNNECKQDFYKNETKHHDGEFTWSESQQGVILSSFFYGYLLIQFAGGVFANKFGAKYVFGIGLFVTSILSLLTPVAARTNLYFLIFTRALSGVSQGVSFSCIHYLISQWSPPSDRTKFLGYTFGGMYTGTIFAVVVSGMLVASFGWPSVFYFFGIMGLVLLLFWMFLVFNNPDEHPYISDDEKRFLEESLQKCSSDTKIAKIPYFSMFTSIHVWAIVVAHFANNWVWYFILTDMPSYFRDILNFDVKQNGFFSALPFFATFAAFQISTLVSDFIRKKKCSTACTRRVMSLTGSYLSALFLILEGYSSCSNVVWSVACMVLINTFLGVNNSSFLINHLDISPRFGALLIGISNTAGTLAGCISPFVTGVLINKNPSSAQYKKVFLISAVISFIGGTIFSIFVSGDVQPWNNLSSKDDEKESKKLINKDSKVSYSTCNNEVDV